MKKKITSLIMAIVMSVSCCAANSMAAETGNITDAIRLADIGGIVDNIMAAAKENVDELTEFVSLLKRCEPLKYSEVRQMQEHIHAQREQDVQQSAARKESWGLE